MIKKLYSKLDLQLATLSAILIITGLLSAVFGFTPLLRFSLQTFFYGFFAGVIIIILKLLFIYQTNKNKKRWSIEKHIGEESINNLSFAKVVIQSAGEETLLRGFIFAPLVNYFNFFGSTFTVFMLNALISAGIYSTREKINYFVGIQATISGIIYLSTHSIFAVIVARFVSEFFLLLASHYKLPHLLSKRFSYVTK